MRRSSICQLSIKIKLVRFKHLMSQYSFVFLRTTRGVACTPTKTVPLSVAPHLKFIQEESIDRPLVLVGLSPAKPAYSETVAIAVKVRTTRRSGTHS